MAFTYSKNKIPACRKYAAALFMLVAMMPSHLGHTAPLPGRQKPDFNHYYAGAPGARVGIAVFTGDLDRLAEGLTLYMQRRADHLIISGYDLMNENAASLAARLGVAVTRDLSGITLDNQPYNTCDSAQNISRWAQDNNLDFVIGVTSDYHARRTRVLLENALPKDMGINMWPVPSAASDWQWQIERAKLTATQIGICNIPGYQISGL